MFTIALAGKGGTGKTTIAALLIRLLRERDDGPILAVDADPNANLNELLGLKVGRTIGELREETMDRIADLPPSLPKERYLEYGLHECLVEDERVDLLVMGHGEGPKCYCMVNHILRKYIDVLRRNYKYVVIDNEAGMEHLSRRTTQDVDAFIIVANADPISLRSAGRIDDLAQKLKLRIKERWLLLNNVDENSVKIEILGLPIIGSIPHDEEIPRLASSGRPIWELSPTSPAKEAAAQILTKLLRSSRVSSD